MLGRYKKAGGFVQLLKLIESCETSKRNNFLQMVESEDIRWAKAIKMKMLTMDRILDWEDNQVLHKIAGAIPEEVVAALLQKYKIPLSERMLPAFTDTQKERIQEISERGEPTEKELMRAVTSFIQEVRSVLSDGSVSVESLDSTLPIPADIEEQLISGSFQFPVEKVEPEKPAKMERVVPSRPGVSCYVEKEEAPAPVKKELVALQNQLEESKEKLSLFAYQNHRLRRENQVLKDRLESLEKRKISS